MRALILATVSLALASPALAQAKMTEWTAAAMKDLLREAGYKVNSDGMAGSDISIAASGPAGQFPVNVFGVRCAKDGNKVACPAADLLTGFKLKDEASKEAAKARASLPDVRVVIGGGAVPTIRIETTIDFAAGISRDELKAWFVQHQKNADTAFNLLKADGLLGD